MLSLGTFSWPPERALELVQKSVPPDIGSVPNVINILRASQLRALYSTPHMYNRQPTPADVPP